MYKKPYYSSTSATCTVLLCFVVPNKGQRIKLGAAKGEELRITLKGMQCKNHMSCLECVSECMHPVKAVELQIRIGVYNFQLHHYIACLYKQCIY